MIDAPSIDPAEIAKFSAMSEEWWDPRGKFAPLHRFQPIRRRFILEWSSRHFSRQSATSADHPFAGRTLLDIGCGGGLMAEPMAAAGFAVTGIDASEKNIIAARLHAEKSGLAIAYRHATAEALAAEAAAGGHRFDLVLNLEVVEHVADLAGYLNASASLVAPGGAMIVATLNKTLKSLALAKIGAEYVLRWLPRGSHDWSRFVPPETLRPLLTEAGLQVQAVQGVAFDPLSWEWTLSGDTSVNYLMTAVKPA